ncbi:BrnA antitoxin family protein [bacterium]|nr:BrnA antitoxin family protein [bacterium]
MKRKFFSDMERLRNMKDDEIDLSECPELDDEFFRTATVVKPESKTTMLIDRDILEWFRSQGEGYQEKINHLLRNYIKTRQLKKA